MFNNSITFTGGMTEFMVKHQKHSGFGLKTLIQI